MNAESLFSVEFTRCARRTPRLTYDTRSLSAREPDRPQVSPKSRRKLPTTPTESTNRLNVVFGQLHCTTSWDRLSTADHRPIYLNVTPDYCPSPVRSPSPVQSSAMQKTSLLRKLHFQGRLLKKFLGFHLPDAPKPQPRVRNYSASSVSSVDSENSILTASPNFRDTSSTGWTRVKNYKQRNLFDEEEKAEEKQDEDPQMFTLKRWPYEPGKNLVSLNDPDFCLDDIMSEDLDPNGMDAALDKFAAEMGAKEGKDEENEDER
uniref:Protein TSSC4 n=1 Tax=Bursaphelenchus xylophilus TaxID=6326 RepID=A0A1I7SQX0_BURXY